MKSHFVALTALACALTASPAGAQEGFGTPTVVAGDNGTDASVSAPSVGAVLATINAVPNCFYVQNQSATTLQVVLDDAAGATTPTIILLGPGGAGLQGASTDPMCWHHGRVRIAGAAGSQFAARSW